MSVFSKLREGLGKTRQGFVDKIETLITGHRKIDEEFYEELEEILIQADVGVDTTMALVDDLRAVVKQRKIQEAPELKLVLKELISKLLGQEPAPLNINQAKPAIIMVVGVNGVGKTTTIGKIAAKLKNEGKKILIAAGDTFRAGAIEQLQIWGTRVGADVIKHQEGADPAAVAFDAVQSAKARGVDVLIVDTAGRLHNKANLMEELKKVKRVIARELPGAPHEVLLVLDATTGQNAVNQAKLFGEAVDITGLVLTKLDGTAKGGVVIAIKAEQNIPVKLIGIGEQVEDLREFVAQEFVDALFDE